MTAPSARGGGNRDGDSSESSGFQQVAAVQSGDNKASDRSDDDAHTRPQDAPELSDIAPTATSSSRRRSKRRTGNPVRSPNAWILYRSHKNQEMETQRQLTLDPTSRGKGPMQMDISRIVAMMWKSEPPEVRERFERLAAVRKVEHERMYGSATSAPSQESSMDTAALWKERLAGLDGQSEVSSSTFAPSTSSESSSLARRSRLPGSSSPQASHSRIKKIRSRDSLSSSASSKFSHLRSGVAQADGEPTAAELAILSSSPFTPQAFAARKQARVRSLTETSHVTPPFLGKAANPPHAATAASQQLLGSSNSRLNDEQLNAFNIDISAAQASGVASSSTGAAPLWTSGLQQTTLTPLRLSDAETPQPRDELYSPGPMSAPAYFQASYPDLAPHDSSSGVRRQSPTDWLNNVELSMRPQRLRQAQEMALKEADGSALLDSGLPHYAELERDAPSGSSSASLDTDFEAPDFIMDPFSPQMSPTWDHAVEHASEHLSATRLQANTMDHWLSSYHDLAVNDTSQNHSPVLYPPHVPSEPMTEMWSFAQQQQQQRRQQLHQSTLMSAGVMQRPEALQPLSTGPSLNGSQEAGAGGLEGSMLSSFPDENLQDLSESQRMALRGDGLYDLHGGLRDGGG